MKSKVVILGAGLTGLSSAYHLKKDYLILEKEKNPGGLCRSVKIEGFTPSLCSGASELSRIIFTSSPTISNKGAGFTFDYTGHLLHLHQAYTKNLVFELLKENLKKIKRNSSIYFQGKYIPYPFQANLWALPEKIKNECLNELSRLPLTTHHLLLTFRDWCLSNYGKGISKYFLFPYNEKIWLHPLKEITTDWVNPFIPQVNQKEIIDSAERKLKKSFGYNAYFYYPKKGGIQSLIDAFTKKIKNIQLNSQIEKINWRKKTIQLSNPEGTPRSPSGLLRSYPTIQYDYLISTIPLPEFLNLLENPAEKIIQAKKQLSWTSVFCINLGIKRHQSPITNHQSPITNYHWVYFPEKEFIFYRVGFYHNFSSSLVPKNCSSLYIEIAHHPRQKLNKEEIISQVKKNLQHCGILNEKDKILVINILRIPYAYVVYDKNRASTLKTIQEFFSANNIFSLGRYGAWKYSFMEESILDGKKIADQINKFV